MKRIFLIKDYHSGNYYSKEKKTFGSLEFASRFYIKEQADTTAELLTYTNLLGPFFIIEGFEKFKKITSHKNILQNGKN